MAGEHSKTDFKQQIPGDFWNNRCTEIASDFRSCNALQQFGDNAIKRKALIREEEFFYPAAVAEILALLDKGEKVACVARKYQVSRQTIYSQVRKAHHFSDDPDVKMRMNFMNHNNLCTIIDIDFRHEKIKIQNFTDKIPLRAFGVVTEPSWEDFEYFIEDRCFPRTRDHAKEILREMGVPFYDPLLIIEKTKGYMAGDNQWILILKKEENL